MPMFGQLVLGPPGSGKSTYCTAMQQFLQALPRPVAVVNLDPANDVTPYDCALDVRQLIRIEDVQEHKRLGPNGGLVFCMEYIQTRLDWLRDRLEKLEKENSRTYLLIDLPGQVELFTHHDAVKQILDSVAKWGHRLTAVHLADSHYCLDPGKFISVLLTALMATIQLEMPAVHLLSKADLIEQYADQLPFNLQYFTEVHDLRYLLQLLQDDPFLASYKKLSEQIVSVIEDYSLVSFQLLNIQEKESMLAALTLCDRANGFCYHETDAPDLRTVANKARDPVRDYNEAVMDRMNVGKRRTGMETENMEDHKL